MTAYVIRRLLMAIPVMLVVAVIVFAILYLAPGDPAMVIAGDAATPADIAAVRHALQLDQPPMIRFGIWLMHVLRGDLGTSIYSGEPVFKLIGARIGPTFSLIVLATLVAVTSGVALGVVAARKQGGFFDRILTGYYTLGVSVPPFVVAYVLIYIFSSSLHWLPVQGYRPIGEGLLPFLGTTILPALSLGLVFSAIIASITRAAMLEVLEQDYIRTAIAKGVKPHTLLYRHALRNAAIPIVTVIGSGVPALIGGTVVTEGIFVVPGIGSLTVEAIMHRDYPVIQGVVLLSSLLYVLANILTDLSYVFFDPRVRL